MNTAIENGFEPALARDELMRADGPSAGFLTRFMTEANLFASFYHDIEYGATLNWTSKRTPLNKSAFRAANERLVTNSLWYVNTFGGNAAKSLFWGDVMKKGTNIGAKKAWRSQHLFALRRFPHSGMMQP